ncbi:hypothetical protein ACN47E_008335 [Coniothyrium glycines]
MTDQIFFDADNTSCPNPPPTYTKPCNAFNVSAPAPFTIFYLATIKPHMDTHTITGPATAFKHLLPAVTDVVSNSPSAIDKLDELQVVEDIWGERTPNDEFFERGFDTFVVEGQRGVYTVLRILREVNREVHEELPAPVYTVVAVGPLSRTVSSRATLSRPGLPGKVMGHAAATRVFGSFVAKRDAQEMARRVMEEMVQGEVGVKRIEQWEKSGKGGGMLLAMALGVEWVVKIMYDDQVHRRAKEGCDQKGEEVSWRF